MSGTRLVLLGTSGGPLPSAHRAGIAQAVVVGGRAYLVDCGYGATLQLRRARLLAYLDGVFLTHLHSDHVSDYFNVFLLGWAIFDYRGGKPIHVWGPGPAGGAAALPGGSGHDGPAEGPAGLTPGVVEMTDLLMSAHAYDLNLRVRQAGRSPLPSLVVPHQIDLDPGIGARGPDRVAPPMEPLVVMETPELKVSAILVDHGAVFPAFAFRFDTADGAIVVSGDTRPSANLIRLAQGADILVHEVFDRQIMERVTEARTSERGARLFAHLATSHTALDDVGQVAASAGVKTLVLSHLVPGGPDVAGGLEAPVPDEHWQAGASAGFAGEVVVGRDLLELTL